MKPTFRKDLQFYRFCAYGFLKNLRFFDAFFLVYLRQVGLSFTEIGSVYAFREIAINVSEIPSGIMSDTVGRKKTLLFSLLLYIGSFILLYSGNSYLHFLIGFAIFGVADAFRSGTHKGMIMEYLKRNHWSNFKISYYGSTRSCSQVGSALSALIGGGIIYWGGAYKAIFLASILPYLLNILNVGAYPSYLNHSGKPFKRSVWKNYLLTARNFLTLLQKAKVFHIIQSSALFSAWVKSIKDYVQVVLVQLSGVLAIMSTFRENPPTEWVIAIGYSMIYLLSAIGSKEAGRFGRIAPYRNAHLLLFWGFSAGCVGGLLYIGKQWVILFLIFIIIYIIENIRKPLLTGVLSDAVPNDILTSILSAQSLLKTGWTVLLALAMGYLTDLLGMGAALIVLSITLLVLTFVFHTKSRQD